MRFSYRYKKERYVSGYVFRPRIPVRLSHNGTGLDTIGLLDSGSDTLSIPLFMAESLGMKLSRKKEKVQGIGGPVEVRHGILNITVESKARQGKRIRRHTIRSARVVVPVVDNEEIDDVLIGRIPFFQHFKITFDENAKRVTLTRATRG